MLSLVGGVGGIGVPSSVEDITVESDELRITNVTTNTLEDSLEDISVLSVRSTVIANGPFSTDDISVESNPTTSTGPKSQDSSELISVLSNDVASFLVRLLILLTLVMTVESSVEIAVAIPALLSVDEMSVLSDEPTIIRPKI